jgi:hypothetical protein
MNNRDLNPDLPSKKTSGAKNSTATFDSNPIKIGLPKRLTAVSWNVMSYGLVDLYQRFGRIR